MKAKSQTALGKKAFVISTKNVELSLTETGGHMAPVTFCKDTKKPIQPYYISPWQEEGITAGLPVLEPLRGDFFCMPFGADNDYKKEKHTVHGEVSSKLWKMNSSEEKDGVVSLSLSMKTKKRPGTAVKNIQLVEGQNVVYVQHVLGGYSGKMCLGHHATLAVPEKEGAMRVSSSPFAFGRVGDRPALATAENEYYSLKAGAEFKKLDKVPTIWKDEPWTDLTRFPMREGFVDIAAIYKKAGPKPAWMAAAVPSEGYLWFSLKDPEILPQTVVWISNKGRHGAPWNGRNQCLGLEDTCAYSADGLKNSAKKNPVSEKGFKTVLTLNPKKPLTVNYIEGVVQIPKTFDRVAKVQFEKTGLRFISDSGKEVTAPVVWDFIKTGTISL